MAQRTVQVASRHGLHARPAALFTQAAKRSGVAVTVAKGDKSANAASILAVITLGVACGDEVTIAADGDGADAILDELVTLLATPDDEK
ncbi:MAG: HPr family phosphocarrier protein [Microbacteriaceae bacterium]|nr:MAG: HPr family phosphocarrier protein [Microbacteriaceae bacterium]